MTRLHSLQFFRRYLASPKVVGAVAPSSRYLAAALARPFSMRKGPAKVLEVGAGTGAVTRTIGRLLGAGDELDVCEIEPALADVLERDVLSLPVFESAREQGRVRLIRGPVQELSAPDHYDFIIAGLPFTSFSLDLTREIIDSIAVNLKPGGTFSYFEYRALRRITLGISTGRKRRRKKALSSFLTQQIRAHQIGRQAVWMNMPPAYARQLQFE